MRLPFQKTLQQFIDDIKFNGISGWRFSPKRLRLMKMEYQEWKTHYLLLNVKDKVVLDVGAGEGETAFLFLKYGAKKVIGIEADLEPYKLLEYNSRFHSIEPLYKYFSLDDLNLNFDCAKIDIEFSESIMLDLNPGDLKPIMVEVHGLYLIQKFLDRGWNVVDLLSDICCAYMSNFKTNGR